jgi:hypothetical protein
MFATIAVTWMILVPLALGFVMPALIARSRAVDRAGQRGRGADPDIERILERLGPRKVAFVGWDRHPGQMRAVIGTVGDADLLIVRTFAERRRSRQDFSELRDYILAVAAALGEDRVRDVRLPPEPEQQTFGWVGGAASMWWRSDPRSRSTDRG